MTGLGCTARDNPFRVDRILTVRYELTEQGWDELLQRYASLGYRASLVGREGSGKTTLREDIETRLERSGWRIRRVQLNRETPRMTAAGRDSVARSGPGELVSIDGAEQLGWFAWQWVLRATRAAGGLLVTLHQPRGLPVLHQHTTSPALLERIVSTLVGSGHILTLDKDLRKLYARYDGNIRDCLRELYDHWAAHGQREEHAWAV
jgi:hypothetical protein